MTAESSGPDAPAMPARHATRAAAGLALAYLAVALCLLPDYGPTWDCAAGECPQGERMLEALVSPDITIEQALAEQVTPHVRSPHPSFAVKPIPWFQTWPFTALLSALSCRLFWTQLGWLPAIQAHHLPGVLMAAGLVFAISRFAARRHGLGAGLALVLSPRFFADAFNNLKDTPEAFLYTLAVFAGYRAFTRGGLRWWVLTGVVTACALAQKANALFIPPQLLLVFGIVRMMKRDGEAPRAMWSWRGFWLATAAFLVCYAALSPAFWHHTIENLRAHFDHVAGVGNFHLRGLSGTTAAAAGVGTAALEGAWLALWTTPPVILVLAVLGALNPRLRGDDRAMLLVGITVPIARTLLPGMVNFDGIRHYLEFYPPVCILAGIGLAMIVRVVIAAAARGRASPIWRRALAAVVVCALLTPGAVDTWRTHPYGSCYFNSLVGGLPGAQARSVTDATDYWGASYWEAVEWLNTHAEKGAAVLVPVGGHVVEYAAPVHLRADITCWRDGDPLPPGPLYLMFITRLSYYRPSMKKLIRHRTLVHDIRVDGGVILRVYQFAAGAEATAAAEYWRAETLALAHKARIDAWLPLNAASVPAISQVLAARSTAGMAVTADRLRALLPPELHDAVEPVLTYCLDP